MHSIRLKITAVTIAAILTCILALGGIGVFTIGLESDRSSVEKMSLISENIGEQLDAYLGSIKQSVEMAVHMADDSLYQLDMMLLGTKKTDEELEKLNTILAENSSEVEHAFASIANHTNGVVTYYYCINSELGSSEHGFYWSNLDEGKFVKQPPLLSENLDINDTEHTTWYYSPLKAGCPVWVGPYKAQSLGDRLTISYVAPIYRYGFLIGVLGMDILFDQMLDLIKDIKIYDTGFVFLMDKDGQILYHPEMEAGTTPDVPALDPNMEIFKKSRSGDELIRYQYNGEERQLAFSTLNNNIKVGVTAPVSEINASQRQLTLMILLVAVVILAIFAVITLLVMNALTKPLLELTEAAQELAEGDYDVVLDYHGEDEVGLLTGAFSRMRDKLKLYIHDLNSMAFTDALTGVKNKSAYYITIDRLNTEIKKRENDESAAFAIVMFDCNYLKRINDENGHNRGDIYLQKACSLICKVFPEDAVFRLGGDEFAVILQNEAYEKRDELMAIFEREIESYNQTTDNPWEKVDLSKGMAAFDPLSDSSAEQVMNRADARMYEDKHQSKKDRE